ncbi:hypothetical protein S40285_07311 [Stachybotrys chlorohalonatus IBT 40285]|uniref:Peroxin 20 n=1 Tax=Stachybotrys chlorohalonatus (strain IBT 40285) TaxID=1283841 RepID=A0A084QRJ6_STAC4|nr:hypothetical protein S40285_07311 [Stachybotrys chlorohalonata IBT 40285]
MADASCSGTTPFKRLVDQQNRDVSHHQDRLRDHSSAHNHGAFRSSPSQVNQTQGSFNAFLDGQPAMPHDPAGRLAAHAAALHPAQVAAPRFGHASPLHAHSEHARASPVPDVSNWAADFQRYSAQAPQQQQRSAVTPIQQPAFASQVHHQPSQLNFQNAFAQAGPGFLPPQGNGEFDQEMSRWMANYGSAAGAAPAAMQQVDAMMDQVARELELNEATLNSTEEPTTAEIPATETATTHFTDLETPEIGSLSLATPEPQEVRVQPGPEMTDVKGKSAVSEAAERLLESVQHEDGDKWKNSVFLSLMRDFRDGRKDIIDNEIRQTDDLGDVPAAAKSSS